MERKSAYRTQASCVTDNTILIVNLNLIMYAFYMGMFLSFHSCNIKLEIQEFREETSYEKSNVFRITLYTCFIHLQTSIISSELLHISHQPVTNPIQSSISLTTPLCTPKSLPENHPLTDKSNPLRQSTNQCANARTSISTKDTELHLLNNNSPIVIRACIPTTHVLAICTNRMP